MTNLPNFLIISPPKTGTSSLYHYLNQHPSIYMSPVKEPGYFILEPGKVMAIPGMRTLNYTFTTLEKYTELFKGKKSETALGESTTLYFYNSSAPERIHALIPDVKLIAVLRNPVERAYSDYLMFYGLYGIESCDDFYEALLAEINQPENISKWWKERRYIEAGMYHKHLSRYWEQFGEDQIKVLFYEDFKNDTLNVVRNIFEFLEVDPEFIPDVDFIYNPSGVPRNRMIHHLTTKPNAVTNFMRWLIPDSIKSRLMSKVQSINYTKPEMDQNARAFLIEIFKDDILKLEKLLAKDLSGWIKM